MVLAINADTDDDNDGTLGCSRNAFPLDPTEIRIRCDGYLEINLDEDD